MSRAQHGALYIAFQVSEDRVNAVVKDLGILHLVPSIVPASAGIMRGILRRRRDT